MVILFIVDLSHVWLDMIILVITYYKFRNLWQKLKHLPFVLRRNESSTFIHGKEKTSYLLLLLCCWLSKSVPLWRGNFTFCSYPQKWRARADLKNHKSVPASIHTGSFSTGETLFLHIWIFGSNWLSWRITYGRTYTQFFDSWKNLDNYLLSYNWRKLVKIGESLLIFFVGGKNSDYFRETCHLIIMPFFTTGRLAKGNI